MKDISFLEQALKRHITNKIPLIRVKVCVEYLKESAIISVRCSSANNIRLMIAIKSIISKYLKRHISYNGNSRDLPRVRLIISYGSDLDYNINDYREVVEEPIQSNTTNIRYMLIEDTETYVKILERLSQKSLDFIF